MLKRTKMYLSKKDGMTLVEVLTALTILTLIIFCFAPLFATNLKTIRTSGDKAVTVYKNAGIMQKVLGNFETGDENSNTGYNIDVANISLTLTGNNNNGFYTTTAIGDVLASDPTSVQDGFQTVMTNAPSSSFQVFPNEITDDFKEAYLTVAAVGTTFVDDPTVSSAYKLYVNKNGTKTQLVKGRDYSIKRANTSDESIKNKILMVVLYGGSDVSYANSPLTFEYKSLAKEIQISAPAMIMVGEDAASNYYYVSRGEVDENGDLVVLRREMDASAKMTSAMNDVEYISKEDNVMPTTGNPLGYGSYVMCGDDGEIRRFWRNNTTGNYYWDGDYTYYTDINVDEVEPSKSHETYTLTKAKNVSYKYLHRGSATNSDQSYVVAQHNAKSNYLMMSNFYSATALVDNPTNAYMYLSNGKMYSYKEQTTSTTSRGAGKTSPSAVESAISGYDNYDYYSGVNYQAVDWFSNNTMTNKGQGLMDGYEAITGTADIPITLTSVDNIVISQDTNVPSVILTADSNNNSMNGMSPETHGIDYPNKTYVLYCGYIPAAYDFFQSKTSLGDKVLYDTGMSSTSVQADEVVSGSSYVDTTTNFTKTGFSTYGNYRGTIGIAAYTPTGNGNVTYGTSSAVYRVYGQSGTIFNRKKYFSFAVYLPYTNISYALVGKVWDASTSTTELTKYFPGASKLVSPSIISQLISIPSVRGTITSSKQTNSTGGTIKDVTLSYYSHPLAVHLRANPSETFKPHSYEVVDGAGLEWLANKGFSTDSFTKRTVLSVSNDIDYTNENTGNQKFFYESPRESITFLDSASTYVPSDEYDIPVSLMVGYTPSGIVECIDEQEMFINSFFNNGIVYIRAGTAEVKANKDVLGFGEVSYSQTGEWYATDNTGFALSQQTNVFHQFYYLNSRAKSYADSQQDNYKNNSNVPFWPAPIASHGRMFGAVYWNNNAHIKNVSMDGGTSGNQYNYLRCHPMADTECTCVSWGTTWNNCPEAMWGTSSGDLFSWWMDLNDRDNADKNNDKTVEAEFQSYKWIDTVNAKTFASDQLGDSTGFHVSLSPAYVCYTVGFIGSTFGAKGATFSRGSVNFIDFYDKTTQELYWNTANNSYTNANDSQILNTAFVSVLDSINDVEYANDMWVAVGDQSGHHPKDYCGSGTMTLATGSDVVKPYSSENNGSWINVRYFVDNGDNIKSETNCYYFWKAVRATTKENVNFVQINNCNGVWYATGYIDTNNNGEFDENEKAVVSRATDPTLDCESSEPGHWDDSTVFWAFDASQASNYKEVHPQGINSVACRDDL